MEWYAEKTQVFDIHLQSNIVQSIHYNIGGLFARPVAREGNPSITSLFHRPTNSLYKLTPAQLIVLDIERQKKSTATS